MKQKTFLSIMHHFKYIVIRVKGILPMFFLIQIQMVDLGLIMMDFFFTVLSEVLTFTINFI